MRNYLYAVLALVFTAFGFATLADHFSPNVGRASKSEGKLYAAGGNVILPGGRGKNA
jgi:hypothetical protein